MAWELRRVTWCMNLAQDLSRLCLAQQIRRVRPDLPVSVYFTWLHLYAVRCTLHGKGRFPFFPAVPSKVSPAAPYVPLFCDHREVAPCLCGKPMQLGAEQQYSFSHFFQSRAITKRSVDCSAFCFGWQGK